MPATSPEELNWQFSRASVCSFLEPATYGIGSLVYCCAMTWVCSGNRGAVASFCHWAKMWPIYSTTEADDLGKFPQIFGLTMHRFRSVLSQPLARKNDVYFCTAFWERSYWIPVTMGRKVEKPHVPVVSPTCLPFKTETQLTYSLATEMVSVCHRHDKMGDEDHHQQRDSYAPLLPTSHKKIQGLCNKCNKKNQQEHLKRRN